MARTSAEEWAKRVERWKDSGLTAKEFADEIGIKATTLSFWCWKLRAGERGRTTGGSGADRRRERAQRSSGRRSGRDVAKPDFVEVPVAAVAHATVPALELVLRDGLCVRIPAGFDEETLSRVVRAVGVSR